MRCPICGAEFDIKTSEAPPFCGPRCKTIDLGRWLGEGYSVPVAPNPDEPESYGEEASDFQAGGDD